MLQSRADIDAVRLVDASLSCNSPVEDVSFPLVYMLKHQAEKPAVSGNKLTIPIRFGLKAVTEDKKQDVILIACRLQVDYVLQEGYVPSAEEIDAFGQGNAIFNCWTYFREFVQSTIARMNYPPVAVPFLRLAPKPESPAKTLGATEVKGPAIQVETEQEPKKRRPGARPGGFIPPEGERRR